MTASSAQEDNQLDLDIYAALKSDPARAIAYLQATYPNNTKARNCIGLIQSIGQPCVVQFTAIDDRKVDSRDLVGKVVLLDFWFKHCTGCISAMPRIKEAAEKYRPQGLVVLAVSLDRTPQEAEEIIQRFALPWPVQFDGKAFHTALAERFCVVAAPFGVLIDRQGRLRHLRVFPGSQEANKLIETLLAE